MQVRTSVSADDGRTRERVTGLLLEHGPQTAAEPSPSSAPSSAAVAAPRSSNNWATRSRVRPSDALADATAPLRISTSFFTTATLRISAGPCKPASR